MPRLTIRDLVDVPDPMWPIIQDWLASASHPVEVLHADREVAEVALLNVQVTLRSPLGAMLYKTGGMLVDNGWLRLLGARSVRMQRSFLDWNGLQDDSPGAILDDAYIVGHDVVGGFFAVNLGKFGAGPRNVFYFAPEALTWQDLDLSYADFLRWAITGDVGSFYSRVRWTGWESEVRLLDGDHGFSFWPMLWTAGQAPGQRSRRVVPQSELWQIQQDLAATLADRPTGEAVRLRFDGDGKDR